MMDAESQTNNNGDSGKGGPRKNKKTVGFREDGNHEKMNIP
jgi:hypothetical protein